MVMQRDRWDRRWGQQFTEKGKVRKQSPGFDR